MGRFKKIGATAMSAFVAGEAPLQAAVDAPAAIEHAEAPIGSCFEPPCEFVIDPWNDDARVCRRPDPPYPCDTV